MSNAHREALIFSRARELARSGECDDIVDIECRLTREGFPEASEILGGGWFRDELYGVLACARGDAITPGP